MVKFSEKKSMLENFRANVLKQDFVVWIIDDVTSNDATITFWTD